MGNLDADLFLCGGKVQKRRYKVNHTWTQVRDVTKILEAMGLSRNIYISNIPGGALGMINLTVIVRPLLKK